MKNIGLFQGMLLVVLTLSASGCATELPAMVQQDQVAGNLVVGRAITVLTGERSRRYAPQLRFFELESVDSSQRYQIEIKSADQPFAIDLPPGRYRLARIQISEGPFMSMADAAMMFSVASESITHVGAWRFGIESPQYGRMLVVSTSADQEERARVRGFLNEDYSDIKEHSIVESLPQPHQMEARLYEVMPYPRYSKYFRRHWW
jgi:hypothetical protein